MEIRVTGLGELKDDFERIHRELRRTLEVATRKAMHYVQSTVPPYPAPRAGQTYVRTVTLGRSLSVDSAVEVRSTGSDIVGAIGTNVVYAPWVISDEAVPGLGGPQAWMHKGRWWTLQGVVRRQIITIEDIIRAAVKKLVEGG